MFDVSFSCGVVESCPSDTSADVFGEIRGVGSDPEPWTAHVDCSVYVQVTMLCC